MFQIIQKSLDYNKSKILSTKEAIKLIESSDPWFSSDYHLFQEFRYDNDVFKNGDLYQTSKNKGQMMIDMHQKYVKPNDVIIIIGDISESEINKNSKYQKILMDCIKSLNGIKILVTGNNDEMPESFYYDCGFVHVTNELIIPKLKVILTHIPYDIVGSKFESDWLNIHGHIHGSRNYWNMDWRRHIDVFPNINGMKPLKYKELLKRYHDGVYDGVTEYHQQI